MVSDEKLIKQGIRYTDALFKELENRLRQGVINSDTLEAFLEKTKEYTTNNPLVTTGYDATLLKIILAETNNHKFTRPAQKELVRVTIENQVGELITNVGEDIKADVRDIVKSGYNEGLSQYEIADNISHRIKTIKNTRANVIARTEIARTATVSDYIINKERGANYFVVDCRSTRCEVCKEAYCKSSPIGGDVEYDIDDVEMLPPRHPNCRCVAVFGIDPKRKKTKPTEDTEPATTRELTPEELKNLKAAERARYRNLQKTIKAHEDWLRANPNASAKEITSHRGKLSEVKKKLEKLRTKALGGATTSVPETTPEPKETLKQNNQTTIKVTREQLEKGLTYSELNEYDATLKSIKKMKKWLEDDPLSKGFSQSDINATKRNLEKRMGMLEDLKKKALSDKPKQETTSKSIELEVPFDKSKHLTKEQLDKMDFKELAEHHGATYKGILENEYDGKKYHQIEQTCSNGETFTIHFEDSAVKSYTKGSIATPNEIIHEVFKVPEALRKETNEIWFKNSTKGIRKNYAKSLYDSLRKNEGGYNLSYNLDPLIIRKYDDPDHKIVINPNYFKRNTNRLYLPQTKSFKEMDEELGWKHAIHHEFVHSGDKTRENWKKKITREISFMDEYNQIEKEEPWFTGYANMKRVESFAEHGGFISRMEANPSEQHKKIQIKVYDENRNRIVKEINYDEYKKMYPKHHAFFMKKFKEGF